MEKRTSPIDRRRIRRGYTLIEAMLASTLLSVTVLAISGTLSASYAQQTYAKERKNALTSGAQLMDEMTALPIDGAAVNDPSIMAYNNYSDAAAAERSKSVTNTASTSAAAAADDTTAAHRLVTVTRKTSLGGATSSTGDFAIVGVQVQTGNQTVQFKRLVTKAESEATR